MNLLILRARAWWFWFRYQRSATRWSGEEARRGAIPGEGGALSGGAARADDRGGEERACCQGVETVPPLF